MHCVDFFGGLQSYNFVDSINCDLKINSDNAIEITLYVLVTLDLPYFLSL